jgi:hypothetical protein
MLKEFDKLLDGTPVEPKPHYLFLRNEARTKREAIEINATVSAEPSPKRKK